MREEQRLRQWIAICAHLIQSDGFLSSWMHADVAIDRRNPVITSENDCYFIARWNVVTPLVFTPIVHEPHVELG